MKDKVDRKRQESNEEYYRKERTTPKTLRKERGEGRGEKRKGRGEEREEKGRKERGEGRKEKVEERKERREGSGEDMFLQLRTAFVRQTNCSPLH